MASTTTPTGRSAPVPRPIPSEPGVPLPPDSISYRLKRRLLGPPLHSDELEHQRLGKPTALAVFASDNLSSSAYATEEILHVLRARWSGSRRSRWCSRSRSPCCVVLGVPDPVVPRDDQGVPVGRRRLPGHQGQLRHRPPPRSPAPRCSPTTSSPWPCRPRPAPPRSCRRSTRSSRTGCRSRCSSSPSSPSATCAASRSRARSSPSPPTSSWSTWRVLLGLGLWKYVGGDLPGRRPGVEGSSSCGTSRRRRPAAAARGCSSCCTPSPPAAPRSPASRPSPTACPRSASRRGRTPARRW